MLQQIDIEHPENESPRLLEKFNIANSLAQSCSRFAASFQELSEITSLLTEGDLVLLTGRPGVGKTTLVMNLALNVAKNSSKSVAYFSMESSAKNLMQQMHDVFSKVDYDHYPAVKFKADDKEQCNNKSSVLLTLPVHIDDTHSMTVDLIIERAKEFASQANWMPTSYSNDESGHMPKLGLIVVDYLELLSNASRIVNRIDLLKDIASKLKKLALELDVTVIAVNQLTSNLESRSDKRPILSDIGDKEIAASFDVILGLYHDKYYGLDSSDNDHVEIYLLKP